MLKVASSRFIQRNSELHALKHPFVLQYPSASLFHPATDIEVSQSDKVAIADRLLHTREHYEFPGLAAVQIGVNIPIFIVNFPESRKNYEIRSTIKSLKELSEMKLPDEIVLKKVDKVKGFAINKIFVCEKPKVLWWSQQSCWAWEACASCCYLMHFIERPSHIIATWRNLVGDTVLAMLTGLASRFFQHEMDHIDGKAYYERVPDRKHAVPLSGFRARNNWKDDFPSLEGRSTSVYSIFTPPYVFRSETLQKSAFINRILNDEIYPGVDFDIEMTTQLVENPTLKSGKLL